MVLVCSFYMCGWVNGIGLVELYFSLCDIEIYYFVGMFWLKYYNFGIL